MGRVSSRLALACACLGILGAPAAQAASLEYVLTDLGSNTWRYDYTLINAPAAPAFDEFTVFFANDLFSSIELLASPPDWDTLVIQPDPDIPADGFFDGLRIAGPMPDGSAASGFSVKFSYLQGLTPGSQRFDLIDSSNFSVVYSGVSVAAQVPEPQTLWLLSFGLGMLATWRVRGVRASANSSRG